MALLFPQRWWRRRPGRPFTLQWHLTNACEYHCAHCYDRSDRRAPNLAEAVRVLSDLRAFCSRQHYTPHVCLTGGDPLAYPHFWSLYSEITRQRLDVSLLGNPLSPAQLDRLLALGAPRSYQVSLEGLAPTNDRLRGAGHFARCLDFLAHARIQGLRTHVMLTLHEGNLDQVLPLADLLRGRTTRLFFNRLSQVGHGACLALPDRERYRRFLADCLAQGRDNPVLGYKDNLFNLLRHQRGLPLGGGCTGGGCGAAANFVALLPDGEVHACRKFPSLLGHIGAADLTAIYHSPAARAYRQGPAACAGCAIRAACRGCMAVTSGAGLDPLRARDPHCFLAPPAATPGFPATPAPDNAVACCAGPRG